MKNKLFCCVLILSFTAAFVFAEAKAKDVIQTAARQESVDESISYIKEQLSVVTAAAEKRALYNSLASLQEQMALYDDAQKSYAQAAAIAAGDAEGMPKKTNEQLVLDAVRCALCCGDFTTADSYLNSAVRNSKSAEIQSYVKLYSQWSSLCRANSVEELNEPLELLKAYLNVSSMKAVHPVILLTLWYVTGESAWSHKLIQDFPSSTEAAIVTGDIQLLPTPFWFFVPKSGIAEQGIGTYTEQASVPAAASNTKADEASSEVKFSKWQLGLFKTESNAKLLCEELKNKGFAAYVTSEKRSSGTTYYIVLVNEDASGNVSEKLRSAGYDCYPVD